MSWIFWSVLIPVVILGILILLHELGHFLVAKWCGVGVVRFAIGFGPALFRKKIGDTEYRIGCIPLGGYVRMVGDISDMISGPETRPEVEGAPVEDIPPELLADKSKWFIEKSVGQRSAIVFAGPLFNIVTGILFVTLANFFYGDVHVEERAIIGKLGDGSPAEIAGLKVGDLVRKFNGVDISKWEELAKSVHGSNGDPVNLTVARKLTDGVTEELDISIQPIRKKIPGDAKEIFLIGISPQINRQDVGLLQASLLACKWVYATTIGTFQGIIGMFTGKVSPKELAGPIFIFDAASQTAQRGLENVLDFMAHLSVSLAVLNLLPIPVLDGGHLLFFLIEAIFGPISIRKREIASQVGLAFLLLLMGVALTNDIRRTQEPREKGEIQWKPDQKEQQPQEKP